MQTFRVPDMVCGGCVRAITTALKAADPAVRVEADVPTHLVKIESNQPATTLEVAIREAGFTPEPA